MKWLIILLLFCSLAFATINCSNGNYTVEMFTLGSVGSLANSSDYNTRTLMYAFEPTTRNASDITNETANIGFLSNQHPTLVQISNTWDTGSSSGLTQKLNVSVQAFSTQQEEQNNFQLQLSNYYMLIILIILIIICIAYYWYTKKKDSKEETELN